MRTYWTDDMVAARLLEIAEGGVMPTVREMTERTGSHSLASQVSQSVGGVEAWADRLGLRLAEHASRKGWRFEAWVASQARLRGYDVVESHRVKSPWDLMINGLTVDVKVANGKEHANGTQWTWRIANKSRCDLYVLVGQTPDMPPFVLVVPEHDAPRTCATARLGARGHLGRWSQWLDRWDLMERAA